MADGDLKNIEKALQSIEQETKNFSTDLKDSVESGVTRLVSKLDALNILRDINQNVSSTKGTKNVGLDKSRKFGELLKIQQGISDKLDTLDSIVQELKNLSASNAGQISNNVATSINEIGTNTKRSADYLEEIKRHIVDGGKVSNSVSSSTEDAGQTSGIHSTVKDILKEITTLRRVLQQKSFTTGNDEMNQMLAEIEDAKIRRERDYEEKQAWLKGEDIKGNKLSKEKDKELKEKFRNENLEREKREKRISSKRSGSSIVANIASQTASLIKEKQTVGGIADKGISAVSQMGPWGAAIGGIAGLLKSLVELGSERDRSTSTYARTVGGGVSTKYTVGDTLNKFVEQMSYKIGASFGEAMSAITEIAEARGRTTERMTAGDIESAVLLKRFGVGAEALNNFDTFGKSLKQTDDYFTKLYADVSKRGLSFKNVSKAVNDNLKMAQSHTFSNGLRGLEQMAEKSTQLKYNMQQVFQFADKVSEVEGAISTSANLSVLGGQFAQFANPMQLLYEGLNDMEALNDRIVGMFGNKAFWNEKTGQMDMTALDREMLKQAAKAAGLDQNEMLNLSYNEGRQRRISSQIAAGTDKTTAEYIKNVGELDENGRAYVALNGEKHYLNAREGEKALTREDYEMLQKESERKGQIDSATLGSIWKETNGIFETLDNMLSYLQEQLGRWVFGIFQRRAKNVAKAENRVRDWAQERGKDEKEALRFYYENKGRKTEEGKEYGFRRFSKNMDRMLEEYNGNIPDAQGKSPGGFSGRITGPSHLKGGVIGIRRGQFWEAEGGETLINKVSSRRYSNELDKIQNGTFNPYSYSNELMKNNMAKMFKPMSVAPVAGNTQYSQNTQNQPIDGRIKIDIPQTITINLAGQGKIGDYDISEIVRRYVDEFMKEAQIRKDFGGFNKDKFYNRSGVI